MVPSVLGLLGCLAISAGCGRPAVAPSQADLIATVDGTPITRADLEREINLAGANGRTNAQQVLEDLIQRERLVARARRLGLENDPEVQRGWKNLLIAKLKERELEPRLRNAYVSEEDLHVALGRDAQEAFSDEVRLAILRVELRPKASPTKRKEAMERISAASVKALALVPNTLGFGPLASEYSDDEATRLLGGDLGWLSADPNRYNLETNVLAAGFALKSPGEISPVIAGHDGLYLVRLISRRAASKQPKAQAEQLARHRSQLQQRRTIEADFAEETRRQIPVTLDTAAVNRLAALRSEATPEAQLSSSQKLPTLD